MKTGMYDNLRCCHQGPSITQRSILDIAQSFYSGLQERANNEFLIVPFAIIKRMP